MPHAADVLRFPTVLDPLDASVEAPTSPNVERLLLLIPILGRHRPEDVPAVEHIVRDFLDDAIARPKPRRSPPDHVAHRRQARHQLTPAVPSRWWMLDAQQHPQPIMDVVDWADWLETHHDERCVARHQDPRWLLTTTFQGLAQAGDDPPKLWVTRIFRGPWDGTADFYATYGDALNGHYRWLTLLRSFVDPPR